MTSGYLICNHSFTPIAREQYTTRTKAQPVTGLPFDLTPPEPRDEPVTFYTTKRIKRRLEELAGDSEDTSLSFVAHRIVEQALAPTTNHPKRRASDAA